MIDPDNPDLRDLGNRDRNFEVPTQQAVGMRIPEFVIRQLVGFSLNKIRDAVDTPQNIVDTLFAMLGAEVRAQIKTWLRDHKNIYLDVSWPVDAVTLPMIVVEPQSEEEDVDNALLADHGGMVDRVLPDGRAAAAPHKVVPHRHVTDIYIGAQDARLTLYLYQLVKFILLSNKSELTQWYDIHNLVLSGRVLQRDEGQFPMPGGYYRLLSLRYMTWFDFAGTEAAAKLVSLGLSVSTFPGSLEVVSEVPFPESP